MNLIVSILFFAKGKSYQNVSDHVDHYLAYEDLMSQKKIILREWRDRKTSIHQHIFDDVEAVIAKEVPSNVIPSDDRMEIKQKISLWRIDRAENNNLLEVINYI